jgi:hypothetical protein
MRVSGRFGPHAGLEEAAGVVVGEVAVAGGSMGLAGCEGAG